MVNGFGKIREYFSGSPKSSPENRPAPKQETRADFPELNQEQAEELGFDSLEQAEAASRKLAEIAKEKDKAKADKLRAELRAMMDDADGEPLPGTTDLKDRVLRRTTQGKANEALLDAAISEAEFSRAGQVLRAKVEIEASGLDGKDAAKYERALKKTKAKLLKSEDGTPNGETEPERIGREAYEAISTLDDKALDELGFDSREQAVRASVKRAEIGEEKNQTRADVLRAELKKMMNDTDGEPMPSNAALREKVLSKAAEGQAKLQKRDDESREKTYTPVPTDSPLEKVIAKKENDIAMKIMAERAAIDLGVSDDEKARMEKMIKVMGRNLTKTVEGTDETRVEQSIRREAEELGFESPELAAVASQKLTEINKEKDPIKAEKLRAELQAMLDDTGGEPVRSNAELKDRLLRQAAELQRRDQEIRSRDTRVVRKSDVTPMARGEFAAGLENATYAAQFDQLQEFADQLARDQSPEALKTVQDYLNTVHRESAKSIRESNEFTDKVKEQLLEELDRETPLLEGPVQYDQVKEAMSRLEQKLIRRFEGNLEVLRDDKQAPEVPRRPTLEEHLTRMEVGGRRAKKAAEPVPIEQPPDQGKPEEKAA